MKEKLYVFKGPLECLCISFQMRRSTLQKVGLSLNPRSELKVKVIGTESDLKSSLVEQALHWIEQYQDKKSAPSFALKLVEQVTLTPLEKKVLEAMAKIPFGSIKTYKELGQEMGSDSYARFVGSVCRKNPFPLFIPCHRIVRADGLGGFTPGVSIKEKLLAHEEAFSLNLAHA